MRLATISLLLVGCCVTAHAAPAINGATISGGNLIVEGSGFGTKTQAAPRKFTQFDTDTVGQVPAGWDAPLATDSLVSATMAHSGSNSLDSSAISKTADYFPRVSWDVGTTVPLGGYLYLSAWLYLDKTGTTATGFNWKGPLLTSGTDPYYWDDGATTSQAIGFAGFYENDADPRWYNTATTVQHSTSGTATYNYCTAGNSWNANSFAFGGWQRVEYIFKMSSAAGASDGAVQVSRVGLGSAISATGCVTNGDTGDLFRYVSLPQGITNIVGGTLNLAMYWDDVYIDTTPQRVELCDAATKSTSTHCEIQPPTAWSDTGITATLNQGTFETGNSVYVIAYNGSNEAGSYGPITLGSGSGLRRLGLRVSE